MPCRVCDDMGVVIESGGQWAPCPKCNSPYRAAVPLFACLAAAALVCYAGLFLALAGCR